MAKPIPFHSSETQVSVVNVDIIQPNKPDGYNGTFIPNYFNFYNQEDCHVIVNGNSTEMFIPAGGFEFGSVYQLQTLKVVESGIHFNFSGTVPAPLPITPTSGKGLYMLGVMAQPPAIILNEGDTQQISVTAVRPVLYNNSTMPTDTTYESNNEAIATVSASGLVSYVGTGYTEIIVSNNGYYDIVNVTCS